MKNRIIKHLSITTAILALFFSCTFPGTNVDPARPTAVSMDALLPSAEAASAWATGGDLVRFSGIMMQHFEGTNAQQLDHTSYLIREADMDGPWFRLYSSSFNTANQLALLANRQNAPHYEGVAKVLMASLLMTLTDAFGDVPYTDALAADAGNYTPEYDTQESIYTTALPTLLDEAIALLGAAESLGGSPGGVDFIYGGDLTKWIAAANSLKVRAAFQMAKRNAGAYDNALTLLPTAISSNADDFEMRFGTSANEANPQYQFTQSRSGNLKISPFFADTLRADDTRKNLFVTPNGEGAYDWSGNFEFSGYYTSINSPVVFMSYAELKFIEAECQLMRAASDPVAAKTALDQGLVASFGKIAGTAVPAAYQAALDDRWAMATTQEDQLAVLIWEKYIACYSQGIIAWNDYRRTGYPAITPNPDGSNAFNPTVNGNAAIPRRLPYPQEERILNNANVPISPPNLQTRFWWDQE